MNVRENMHCIVKKRCEESGTKQKYWAEKCRFTEVEFSQLLNGHKRIITDVDIEKFCIGLGVSPNDLFGYSTGQDAS